jgi:hypothetical protein
MATNGEDVVSGQGNIRDIVELVRSGRINKADAFNELRTLLKNPSRGKEPEENETHIDEESEYINPKTAESIDLSARQEEDDNTTPADRLANSTSTAFSKEDRRLLINKLIEKKRQSKIQQSYDSSMLRDSIPADSDQYYNDNSYDGNARHLSNDFDNSRYTIQSKDRSDMSNIERRERPRSAGHERPRSAGHIREYNIETFDSRRSTTQGAHAVDLRSHKLALAESATRAEMFKECTFRPTVKPLPSAYGPLKEKDAEFTDRVMRWQREKAVEATRRKTMNEQAALQDCTFKPRINRNSDKAVRMNRGDKKEVVGERLYRSHFALSEQKNRMIEEEKKKDAEEVLQECSFHPNLVTKNAKAFKDVAPKYNKDLTLHKPASPSKDVEVPKDCTFTPKVRGVVL